MTESAASVSSMRATEAAPAPFTGLVVFGDSLSDNGNAGRFSNGPVWVEHLAQRFGVALVPSRQGGTNYAVGGARAHGGPDDLGAQANAYLSARTGGLNPRWLHVVYAGANDLLAAGYAADREAMIRSTAAAVGGVVADLAAAGATRILVPNLPDIGLTPALRMLGPALTAAARALTRAYNEALERELERVATGQPVRVHRLDVFALAERVVANPTAAGFRNVTDPCLGGPSCAGMLFWDQIHPTADAHARLAAAALTVIEGLAPE